MKEEDSLFRQFGNCMGQDYGSYAGCAGLGKANAQCCKFEVVNEETITGKFCVTDGQRSGKWQGTYRDYDYTLWKWQCKEPETPVAPPDDDKEDVVPEVVLPPWSTYEDKNMEWILWTIYLSGELWVIGFIVMLPLGLVIYPWLAMLAMWNFIEIFMGVGTFGEWFMGPFLKYWITGPFIYILGVLLTIIPGVNFISAFLVGWWAVLDYYDYNYVLFEGPTLPGAEPMPEDTPAE